jgi:hypothetical protein
VSRRGLSKFIYPTRSKGIPQLIVMNAIGRDKPGHRCHFSVQFPPPIRVYSLFFDKHSQIDYSGVREGVGIIGNSKILLRNGFLAAVTE